MRFFKEIRDAIMEIQYVLHDDQEPFPRSKANMLCDNLIEMLNELQHEPASFRGWSPWREKVYAELGQQAPSRSRMKNARRQRDR